MTTGQTQIITGGEHIAYYWQRGRDGYGRSVHQLITYGTYIRLGIVVKHPLRKAGEQGSYWAVDWDTNEQIGYYPTLAKAKAGLTNKKGLI